MIEFDFAELNLLNKLLNKVKYLLKRFSELLTMRNLN